MQEAACASLGELIQHGGDVLLPYIVPIVSAISAAFGKYQAKNLLSLFDTVGMLAGVWVLTAGLRLCCAQLLLAQRFIEITWLLVDVPLQEVITRDAFVCFRRELGNGLAVSRSDLSPASSSHRPVEFCR